MDGVRFNREALSPVAEELLGIAKGEPPAPSLEALAERLGIPELGAEALLSLMVEFISERFEEFRSFVSARLRKG